MSDLEDWENESFDEDDFLGEIETKKPVATKKPEPKKPARAREQFDGELAEDDVDEDDARAAEIRRIELGAMEQAKDLLDGIDDRDGADISGIPFEEMDPKTGAEFDKLADLISAKLRNYNTRDNELLFIPMMKRILRGVFADTTDTDDTKEMVDICSVIHNETVDAKKKSRRKGKSKPKPKNTKGRVSVNISGRGPSGPVDEFDGVDEYDFM
ncbi:hypothetical protein J8273_6325 [Carpediemonas membranifera]|uniref:Eukaryotic translation initiation factor 3 30 kDa subunit n=1 Tax=Carpediemonas membranifera TaxID=201153 RepID=A0A8J6AU30_9EUKA|nr:hypothetical protein J8273_6325 [Carpediemonas membranifera]|eukprot:KAG9391560.1 hypothetical protein J8273_6325 [Carpediemonas membranifera]